MTKFLTKRTWVVITVIALVGIGAYFAFAAKKAAPQTTVEVKRGSVAEEVSVSGTVKATSAVDLAFERVGKVGRILVAVGDRAEAGLVLAVLSNGTEVAARDDARAKLAAAEAHYNDLKSGGRPEEVSVKQTELEKAEEDLATDYSAVPTVIIDAYNKADNAVHRQADTIFSNADSGTPQLQFSVSDQQAGLDARSARATVGGVLTDLKNVSGTPSFANDAAEATLQNVKNDLLAVSDFLVKTNRALNAALNVSDATVAADKDALNTARTNVNTALTAVISQIQTISTQKITVATAKNNLELTKAAATPEAIAEAGANVASAAAGVASAEAALAKTYIVAPISGVVTAVVPTEGEIVAANTTVVSVMNDNFKIEAFIPEADIAKVSVGNSATVTLDAYGNDTIFPANVISINPAETIIDGVSTYKTTLLFDKKDQRIRSGMTANTTIASATHNNVLVIPQRAVYGSSGKKFVLVIKGKTAKEEREIKTGIRGSAGEIEVLNGLSEGESVVTSNLPR